MTGDGANDTLALSRTNIGTAVEGATNAAHGAADIILTEPGLSTIVHTIYGSPSLPLPTSSTSLFELIGLRGNLVSFVSFPLSYSCST